MNKLIRSNSTYKLKNIGQKISTYRKCADMPANIMASRCGISLFELEAIEKGQLLTLDIALILRIAEVLGISYYDLFETDDEQYFTNIKDAFATDYILQKCKGYKFVNVAKHIDISPKYFTNWISRGHIPSPFVLTNIMALLKIDSAELNNAKLKQQRAKEKQKPPKEKPVETLVEKKAEKAADVMEEVVKAINVYKNVDTLKAELNEIIRKAQNLLNMLGA